MPVLVGAVVVPVDGGWPVLGGGGFPGLVVWVGTAALAGVVAVARVGAVAAPRPVVVEAVGFATGTGDAMGAALGRGST